MDYRARSSVALFCAALMLQSCGGGGGGEDVKTHDGDAMDKIEYIRLLDEAIRLADDLNEKIDRMGEMMKNGCPVRQ